MMRLMIILLVYIGLVSCGVSLKHSSLLPSEFYQLLDTLSDNAIVIDVRTPEEWQEGVIKHPIMMDYYDKDFKNKVLNLPKDRPILVYCHIGYRSRKTQKWLIKNGYNHVINLESGIVGWRNHGYKVDTLKVEKILSPKTHEP